ncbi:MoxR family ATPase [Paenibacillus sp. TRM 82003]|nr:MoxR family ATPase [Paenibacillus sp. TRM 82003]
MINPITSSRSFIAALFAEIHKQVVGQEEALQLIAAALLAEGHVLLEDVPGVGKTTMAKALAQAFQADFQRVQATPDLLPQDVSGGLTFRPSDGAFELRKGPLFTQFLLFDEINRATPRTVSVLLEAMAEGQVTIDGRSERLPQPFFVIATQNPIESQGVFPLPEAQLDRFLVKVKLGYPSKSEESRILARFRSGTAPERPSPVLAPEQLLEAQRLCRGVHVSMDVENYLLDIVRETRDPDRFSIGASPRASLALLALAQAFAWMDGRGFVSPDDIRRGVVPVLGHRVWLTPERSAKGETEASALQDALERVPVPTELAPASERE